MNPKTYKAVGLKILVLIDKQKQKEKTKLKSGFIVPPAFEYMKYLLQYGPIVSVGEKVADPLIKVGRTAIFHHLIEEEDRKLIDVTPEGNEIRVVDSISYNSSHQLIGIIDEEGNIFPMASHVICYPEKKPELEALELQDSATLTKLKFNTQKVGSLFIAVLPKKEEEIYHNDCEVAFVHPEEEELKPGETIKVESFCPYPLEINGQLYWWVLRDFINTKLIN